MTEGLPEKRFPMNDPRPMPPGIEEIVQKALAEDLGDGDVTTSSVLSEAVHAKADLVFRDDGVVAGLVVAEAVFRTVSAEIKTDVIYRDGSPIESCEVAMTVEGPARAILAAERVALNFVGRLSGIATLTADYVKAVSGTGAQILDTRKTTPLLRSLEKYAVRAGGGSNHRAGLYDAVLIKDNHLAFSGLSAAEAVRRARSFTLLPIEVEVETEDDMMLSAREGADIILLDNFTPEEARAAIKRLRDEFPKDVKGSPLIEISGGVTLGNVSEYAKAGADRISIGRLTHSARCLDVALDISPK